MNAQAAQTQVAVPTASQQPSEAMANEESVVKLYYGKKGSLVLEESDENLQLLITFLENYKKNREKKEKQAK